jgi:hypothetical protein
MSDPVSEEAIDDLPVPGKIYEVKDVIEVTHHGNSSMGITPKYVFFINFEPQSWIACDERSWNQCLRHNLVVSFQMVLV